MCLQTMVLFAQEPQPDRLITNDPKQLLELSYEGGKAVLVTSIADFENRDEGIHRFEEGGRLQGVLYTETMCRIVRTEHVDW